MICVVSQHFNFNRIILLSIGLWPYQRTKLIQFQMMLFFSILISCVIYQFSAFVFVDCTPDLVFKVLSLALFFCMYTIEYNSFRINSQTVSCWFFNVLPINCSSLKFIPKFEQQDECRKLFSVPQMILSLEQLQCICDDLKDEKEINIMKKYGTDAKRYTALFVCKKTYTDFQYTS
ncbi:PREDICTED: uncharacterized protein LOC105458426 isoform X1 [Wasmannia auropunctata]|uniref:uncharacterized protein LOC105458426 isoform X1 n=1 Tax=Wasmannia auropunctata TaxID=64793 RepID=UPI0005EEB2B0|nr:PREDICTED: uncharacterized protein LOC105458426 isoform X1 [Wasmannia auropunctata]